MKKNGFILGEETNSYIKDIRKIPVTTHQRQEEICELINSGTLTESEKNKLLEELVLGSLRFVISIAKSYQNQGLDLMDLISEGNIGLIKAAERFDTKSGWKFISYAVWWVKQSIMVSLNEHSRMIRIPLNALQKCQKDSKTNTPSPILPYCVGLFNPINDNGDGLNENDRLIDMIVNENSLPPDHLFDDNSDIKRELNKMLNILEPRERLIIEKSFGLNNGVQSDLADLAEELKCSKVLIQQLKDKSLKKLRNESFTLLNLY